MTKLLEEALARLRVLPDEEQNRAAEVLLAFAREHRTYSLSDEQIAGVEHAMGQADAGAFASDKRLRGIFGR